MGQKSDQNLYAEAGMSQPKFSPSFSSIFRRMGGLAQVNPSFWKGADSAVTLWKQWCSRRDSNAELGIRKTLRY